MEGLDAGRYNIGVTWAPYSRVATNVPVTVSGGSQPETVRINQQISPSEHVDFYQDRGSDWIDAVLDYEYADNSEPLRIEISNLALMANAWWSMRFGSSEWMTAQRFHWVQFPAMR